MRIHWVDMLSVLLHTVDPVPLVGNTKYVWSPNKKKKCIRVAWKIHKNEFPRKLWTNTVNLSSNKKTSRAFNFKEHLRNIQWVFVKVMGDMFLHPCLTWALAMFHTSSKKKCVFWSHLISCTFTCILFFVLILFSDTDADNVCLRPEFLSRNYTFQTLFKLHQYESIRLQSDLVTHFIAK